MLLRRKPARWSAGYGAFTSFHGDDWIITNTKQDDEKKPSDDTSSASPSSGESQNGTVNTGDSSSLGMWIALTAVSAVGIAAMGAVIYHKRKLKR